MKQKYKNKTSLKWLALLLLCILPMQSFAIQESRSLSGDKRIKTYVYDPNEVFVFVGHYRYATSIEFASDELVQSISLGDSLGWQITPQGSRIFLKPIDQDATTNMTLITTKRIYLFELHAEEADDIRDDDLAFSIRFSYPDSDFLGGSSGGAAFRQFAVSEIPDFEGEPELYNFNYSITGSQIIAPIKIFDDGEFTYVEFRGKNADIPAIFLVDEFGNESIINYRAADNYIIIERVGQQFTLRHGADVACLFNEANPLIRKKAPRKKTKFLGIL